MAEEIQELFYNAQEMKQIVKTQPEAIRFYKNTISKEDYEETHYDGLGNDSSKDAIIFSVYQEAINHGLKIDIDLFLNYPEFFSNTVFFHFIMKLNKENSFYVQFYTGEDVSVYIEAVRLGYQMYDEEIKKFQNDSSAMKKLSSVYPEAVRFYRNTVTKNDFFEYSIKDFDYPGKKKQGKEVFSVYDTAVSNGLVINEELFHNYPEFCLNDVFMYYALDTNKDFVKYYKGNNESVYMKAIRLGYSISSEELEKCSLSEELFLFIIDTDPLWEQLLYYYRGQSPRVYEKAIEKGYKISYMDVFNHKEDTELFRLFIKDNLKWLPYYEGNDPAVFLEAIDLYHCEIPFHKIEKYRFDKKIMREFIRKDSIYAAYYLGDNREELFASLHIPVSFPSEIISFYKGNLRELFSHYGEISKFLSLCNISEEDFNQYLLGSDVDWLEAIVKIITSEEKKQSFIQFKEYMDKNYYSEVGDSVSKIDHYLTLLLSYNHYPEFCSFLTQQKQLDEQEKSKIRWLFSQKEIFSEKLKPKSFADFDSLYSSLKESYQEHLDYTDIDSIKNTICKMLFNEEMIVLKNKLMVYGNTLEIRKLQFNDRVSPVIKGLCDEMILYTSMIEDIVECEDEKHLKNVIKRLFDHFDYAMECSRIFEGFDDKIRTLYECDIQEMLTSISNPSKDCIDLERSQRYGIDVIDLSNQPYVLLAHTKSFSETVEELVKGEVREDRSFISFAPISYRNQLLFGNENSLTFGYDVLPNHSFIGSSKSNFNSNGMIQKYDYQFYPDTSISQRGILETSAGVNGCNSEVLCYREGLKPSCIILPNGREATDEELLIAYKYGLKFVITQELGKRVDNVQRQKREDSNFERESHTISSVQDRWQKEFYEKNTPRRIAVFSDAHALFEPTLAILEDIRRKGITEIYSLGDNIGTGPNPREVMELLDDYHVQSIKGNHELYVVDGIQKFEKHLRDVNGLDEAKRNVGFTRGQLTGSQIEEIKMYPSLFQLLVGGEKILLSHTNLDYNTNKPIIDTNGYSLVLKGHTHFEKVDGNMRTLRSSSFGKMASSQDAYYVILTEREDGGFDTEICMVPFDRENLMQELEDSSLADVDKEKIRLWL